MRTYKTQISPVLTYKSNVLSVVLIVIIHPGLRDGELWGPKANVREERQEIE